MSSVRLYARQIARFSPGNGAKIIACAVRRYQSGEFVIQNNNVGKNSSDVLRIFPIRKKPPFPDETLRRILDAHFNTPRPELDREIKKLDAIIAEMLRNLPPYTIEAES